MRSTILIIGSLALLAVCTCAPGVDVIQHIPAKPEETPSATEKDGAVSGVAEKDVSKPVELARQKRSIGGEESDLLPSAHDVELSPFGDASALDGRGRIKVLPGFLG